MRNKFNKKNNNRMMMNQKKRQKLKELDKKH